MRKINFLMVLTITIINLKAQITLPVAATGNVLKDGTTANNAALASTPTAGFKLSVNGAVIYYGTGVNTVTSPTIYFRNTTATTGRIYAFNSDNTGLFTISDATGGTSPLTHTNRFVINSTGKIGIGISTPTSLLHLNAGTTAAGTAPFKFTSGPATSAPEIGAMHFTNGLLMLDSSNSKRDTIATRAWIRYNYNNSSDSTKFQTKFRSDSARVNTYTAIAGKQVALVSATNIKTINSSSLLGSGNIAVEALITAPNSIKKYFNGYKQFVSLNSDSTTEGSTNLYYTNARAQAAIFGTTSRITLTSGVVDISSSYVGQTSITTLGTVSAGTWNGTTIGSLYGGTGQSTVANGDLLYGSATNTWNKLASGTNGQVLTLSGGVPSWATPAVTNGSGGGTPAGNNTQIQFNNAGTFGADPNLTWDSINKTLGVGTAVDSTAKLKVFGTILVGNNIQLSSGLNNSIYTVALGNSVLSSATGSGSGIAVGYQTLNHSTIGVGNIGMGYQSLYNVTTGSSNVSIGNSALQKLGLGGATTGTSYHVAVGAFALNNFINSQSSFISTAIGYASQYSTTTGEANTSVGASSLYANTTGSNNSAFGYWSLRFNTTGNENMAVGTTSLRENTTGNRNVGIGRESLRNNSTGSGNTGVGYQVGYNSVGDYNVYVGYQAGYNENRSNKLYINNTSSSTPLIFGDFATKYVSINGDSNSSDSLSSVLSVNSTSKGVLLPRMNTIQMNAIPSPANGLMIINTDSLNRPFIYSGTAWRGTVFTNETGGGGGSVGGNGWGLSGNIGTDAATQFIGTSDNVGLAFRTNNTTKLFIASTGSVGIGTTNISDTAYKLFVEKGIHTRKIKIDATAWADYVFDKDYKLPTLPEVDKFIQQNKHLPGVQSTAEVEKNGIDLGENQALLLKKVEELTLYMIELNKKVEVLAKENEELKKKVNGNN